MKTFLILLLFSFSSWGANYPKLKLCLTGATEKTIPHYGDAFYQGALLAFEKLPKETQEKIEIVLDYYDPVPLAPFHKVKELLIKGCSALVGFSTGNDLLAAQMQVRKTPIMVVSIYGDPHPDFIKDGNIFTLQPGPEVLLLNTLRELELKNNSKALVVTAADRSEMVAHLNVFKKIIPPAFKTIEYVEVLETDQNISRVEELLKKENYDYVLLFTRSSIGAKIIDSAKNRDFKIIGTKYFGSPELPAFLNFLSNKSIEAYYSRQNFLDHRDKGIEIFSKEYEKRFSSRPMIISLESYNLVNYFSKLATGLQDFSPENVLRELKSTSAEFTGIGGVEAKPLRNLQHKGLYFMRIQSSGYEVLK